jgi:hypothetical protein
MQRLLADGERSGLVAEFFEAHHLSNAHNGFSLLTRAHLYRKSKRS